MDVNPPTVATIFGDVEVEHAIATLVLAFAADPVARWIYNDPKQYLLHIPRLFRALGDMALRWWIRFTSARRLRSFPCYVTHVEAKQEISAVARLQSKNDGQPGSPRSRSKRSAQRCAPLSALMSWTLFAGLRRCTERQLSRFRASDRAWVSPNLAARPTLAD